MSDQELVTEYLDLSKPPQYSEKELKMLEDLENRPIVYDEDCPELTAEQVAFIKASYGEGLVYDEDCPPSTPARLARFRRVKPQTVRNAAQ